MKISINIEQKRIDEALCDVHCKYWAQYLEWTGTRGCVVESDSDAGGPETHAFDTARIRQALTTMIEAGRPEAMDVIRGETDGPCRDVFLQYVVFGKLKYG